MENSNNHQDSFLPILLALSLVLLFGGAFLFLVSFLFGVAAIILIILVGVVLLGYLHYVLWGHTLSQQTAGERAEEERRQQLEAPELYEPPPHQRF